MSARWPLERWPTVELGAVARLRTLAAALPHATVSEARAEVPFEDAWAWLSDLERSVPAFDGQVRRITIRERAGTRLVLDAASGPFAALRLRFDALVEPGWCLMIGRRRLYVVGMVAEPDGPSATRLGLLEGIPRPAGRIAMPLLRRHVTGDVGRMADRLEQR